MNINTTLSSKTPPTWGLTEITRPENTGIEKAVAGSLCDLGFKNTQK